MKREAVKVMASRALALALSMSTARNAQAQEAKNPYPSMAPIEKMDRDAEIALARSAAPSSVSCDATVVILGKNGYETAVEGKNGFICIVERGWMNSFNSPEFWSPKTRGAECFNPSAARIPIIAMGKGSPAYRPISTLRRSRNRCGRRYSCWAS
jgi:hypothetical protein